MGGTKNSSISRFAACIKRATFVRLHAADGCAARLYLKRKYPKYGIIMETNVNQQLKAKLHRAFQLTYDLVAHLNETSLNLDLPNLPSNTIAGQLWCMVGARQSYHKAIEMAEWKGFSCSLATPKMKESVLAILEETAKKLNGMDFTQLSAIQIDFAFNLLEHEIQHHGQLIRFVYANGLTFPESWHKRYTV